MLDETDSTERHEHRRHRGEGSIWVGIAFILLGLLLILQMTGAVHLANWWALFILIPALASLASAVNAFVRSGGQFTRAVSGGLGGALFIGAVAVIFLLRLDWDRVWPVFIIIAGVSVLMGAFARRDVRDRHP